MRRRSRRPAAAAGSSGGRESRISGIRKRVCKRRRGLGAGPEALRSPARNGPWRSIFSRQNRLRSRAAATDMEGGCPLRHRVLYRESRVEGLKTKTGFRFFDVAGVNPEIRSRGEGVGLSNMIIRFRGAAEEQANPEIRLMGGAAGQVNLKTGSRGGAVEQVNPKIRSRGGAADQVNLKIGSGTTTLKNPNRKTGLGTVTPGEANLIFGFRAGAGLVLPAVFPLRACPGANMRRFPLLL